MTTPITATRIEVIAEVIFKGFLSAVTKAYSESNQELLSFQSAQELFACSFEIKLV